MLDKGLSEMSDTNQSIQNQDRAQSLSELESIPSAQQNLDPIRLLVLDDNPAEIVLLKKLLDQAEMQHQMQFSITTETHFSQAKRLIRQNGYDACVMDYHLDTVDGLEAIKAFKEAGFSQPIIFLTGSESNDLDLKLLGLGASDFLSKNNLTAQSLAHSIRYALIRYKAHEILRANEARYRMVLDNIDEFVYRVTIDPQNPVMNHLEFISERVASILGYSANEIMAKPELLIKIMHPDDRVANNKRLAHSLGHTVTRELRAYPKDRENFVWLEDKAVPEIDAQGRLLSYVGVVRDITERRQHEEKLRQDALHDQLTGLPNRLLFTDRLSNAIERNQRRPENQYAVLFLDLDRFKNINDSLGHLIGDRILQVVAERLQKFLRPGDCIARLGGDEFAILLEDVAAAYDSTFVADRIQETVSAPIRVEGSEVYTTASIGIALSTSDYKSCTEMIRDADTAMYKAKSEGRARYEVFDTNMHSAAVAVLEIETQLRKAIENNELSLRYQPIIDMQTFEVKAFEALLRWQHPKKGFISPVDFIPVAEETGLIVSIGQWVVEEACRQLAQWQQELSQSVKLTINLSARQFSQIDLIEQIDNAVTQYGVDPKCLKFEITETVIMDNAECINAILAQFQTMGFELAMDDFGTGYSSLSYLHRLPINTIKIDRSFISRLTNHTSDDDMVKTIITLAHNLNIDVVAEGIENHCHVNILRQLNCEYGQGYLFAKPLFADQAKQLLENPQQLLAQLQAG